MSEVSLGIYWAATALALVGINAAAFTGEPLRWGLIAIASGAIALAHRPSPL